MKEQAPETRDISKSYRSQGTQAPIGKPKKDRTISIAVRRYLLAYNALQTIGWSHCLYRLFDYYLLQDEAYRAKFPLWDCMKLIIGLYQNLAFLEIIHAFCGWVKSNPIITTFQVFSRIIVLMLVVAATPTAELSPGLPLAFFAWSITEIIRYSYYALNLVQLLPTILVYLRYTTFIVLYPIGVTGELLCFWWAQDYASKVTIWTLQMPNRFNLTFSYYAFLWIIMLLYIPLFPRLYMHMFNQRRKVLGYIPQHHKKHN